MLRIMTLLNSYETTVHGILYEIVNSTGGSEALFQVTLNQINLAFIS